MLRDWLRPQDGWQPVSRSALIGLVIGFAIFLVYAFTAFWGFENFLYIATYMGDARTAALPLVGSDESDWAILLSQWGVLHLDRTIAMWTRAIGWIGMISTVVWLARSR